MKVQPGLYRLSSDGNLALVASEQGLRVIVEFDDGITMVFPVDIVPRIPPELTEMFDRKPEVDVAAALTEAADLPPQTPEVGPLTSTGPEATS